MTRADELSAQADRPALLHAAAVTSVGVPPSRLSSAMRGLETISLHAIARLLSEVGAFDGADPVRSADEVIQSLRAAPRHAWLVRRWLATLEACGVLQRAGNGWQRTTGTSIEISVGGEDGGSLASFYDTLGFPAVMAEVHGRALQQLDRLVRDEVPIQQILFGDGNVLAGLGAYQSNVFTGYLNAACGHVLQRQATRAIAAPLRVLELGGGVGLATAAVLQALGTRRVEYRFTDVSVLFSRAAQQRFGGTPGFATGRLDIDAEFEAQGIAPASVDAVLATNVLHNASHVGESLRRIRRALPPGGCFVFTESTRENAALLTCMQFLLSPPAVSSRGRWRDRRAGTGLVFIDEAGWREELKQAGFETHAVIPEPGSPLALAGQQLFHSVAV